MCTAAAGSLMAITGMASQALSINAQRKQAAATAQSMVNNAVTQGRADVAALNLRGTQIANSITLDQVRRYSQGRRERATVSARTADAGVSGGSTLRDAVSSVIQEEMDLGTLEAQKKASQDQIKMEKLGVVSRTTTEINRAKSIVNAAPSGISSVLGIISAGVSGFATGKQLEPRR